MFGGFSGPIRYHQHVDIMDVDILMDIKVDLAAAHLHGLGGFRVCSTQFELTGALQLRSYLTATLNFTATYSPHRNLKAGQLLLGRPTPGPGACQWSQPAITMAGPWLIVVTYWHHHAPIHLSATLAADLVSHLYQFLWRAQSWR